MASVKSRISQLCCSYDQAAFDHNHDLKCDNGDGDDHDNGGDDDDTKEIDGDDILGVICDVDALSLRWRSPENCHDMFES